MVKPDILIKTSAGFRVQRILFKPGEAYSPRGYYSRHPGWGNMILYEIVKKELKYWPIM